MVFKALSKLLLLFLSGLLTLTLFQQCCDDHKPYTQIRRINPTVTKAIDTNITGCTIPNSLPPDTLWIDLKPQMDFVVSNIQYNEWSLFPTAKAYQCPHDGSEGLKNDLKTINIQLINDTTYDVTNQAFLIGRGGKDVNNWLRVKPDFFPNCIRISNISTTDTIFKASVTFTFENGDFVKGKTDTFVWKHH